VGRRRRQEAPETLKTIRDLVAGVTGFSAERGDQLIVETLPFESSLNAEPPSGAPSGAVKPSPKGPAWLEFATRYRYFLAGGALGLVLLAVVAAVMLRRAARRRRSARGAEVPEELPAPFGAPQLGPPVAESPARIGYTEEDRDELAERVRELAKRDLAVTANVLRMWLGQTES